MSGIIKGTPKANTVTSEQTQNNSEKFSRLILSSINASDPDLAVMGKRIHKFNVFENQHFVYILERLNYPVIAAISFIIPGISKIRSALTKAIHHSWYIL